MKDYYAKREKDIRERWFPNHVASRIIYDQHPRPGPENVVNQGLMRFAEMPVLVWRKTDTSNYFVRYTIHGRVLMVYGDIGEAIYGWSDLISFEWLAGLDLDYFRGKCLASELGRNPYEWDADVAQEAMDANFKMWKEEEYADVHPEAYKDAGGKNTLGHRDEWIAWLHVNGWDCFGEAYTDLARIGDTIPLRVQAHLIGIQMALAQLEAAKLIT